MNTQIIPSSPTPFNFDSILAKRDLAKTTRYRYGREIEAARAAGVPLTDAAAVAEYAADLPSSRKAFLRAAVNLIADEIVQAAKANATPDNVANMQAAMWRAESLKEAIHVKQSEGQRPGKWLSLGQVNHIFDLCQAETAQGLRDKVLMALLIHAGLRRHEACNFTWADIVHQGDEVVLAIKGKGAKNRKVPISGKVHNLLMRWADMVDPEVDDPNERKKRQHRRVIRSIDKGGNVGDSMSGQAVLNIVVSYGERIGEPKLRPHDLRRTCGRILYNAGVDIGTIKEFLGHASVVTTQLYLGLTADVDMSVLDSIPL